MDYEKKYKEALSRAKVFELPEYKKIAESIFPELAESEDERIRKALICGMYALKEQHKTCFASIPIDNAIAWLEKQGEQKPIDKVEPKFKVGDWILYSGDHYEGVRHITKIDENGYYIERNGLPHGIIPFNHEICMRLWTIQDAKDGDVLAESKGDVILMFRGIGNARWDDVIDYHFYYDCYRENFIVQEDVNYWGNTENNQLKPATKEQRDILFQKMSEASYEWDTEKKELKKIEQKLTDKVEPKFNVGDWLIQNERRNIIKVVSRTQLDYEVVNTLGQHHKITSTAVENNYHLWSIEDAKDGDVLCYKDEISLYKHDIKNCTKQETTFGGFVYHCCYDGKRFIIDSLYSLTEQDKIDIHPATKEQRDILFQKMREASYEWDTEKKELKKIEQNLAWSEEDECYMSECIGAIATKDGWSFEEKRKTKHWLKSLKDRYTWKPSDEQIKVCKEVYADILSAKGFDLGTVNSELNRLEEQLSKFIKTNSYGTIYISKAALVAEIEKRIKEHHSGYLVCLKDILSFLNTLEVKDVDLEKDVDKMKR